MLDLFPDLINPLDGAWGRVTQGPMHRFTFHPASGFSGAEVEKLLGQYYIPIWGREMDDPEERAFLVKRAQANWAEYLLCRAGVPLTSPLLNPRNARFGERHDTMPTPWQSSGIHPYSFVSATVAWLDKLLG